MIWLAFLYEHLPSRTAPVALLPCSPIPFSRRAPAGVSAPSGGSSNLLVWEGRDWDAVDGVDLRASRIAYRGGIAFWRGALVSNAAALAAARRHRRPAVFTAGGWYWFKRLSSTQTRMFQFACCALDRVLWSLEPSLLPRFTLRLCVLPVGLP